MKKTYFYKSITTSLIFSLVAFIVILLKAFISFTALSGLNSFGNSTTLANILLMAGGAALILSVPVFILALSFFLIRNYIKSKNEVDEDLLNYISKRMADGTEKKIFNGELISHGWTNEDIESAYKVLSVGVPAGLAKPKDKNLALWISLVIIALAAIIFI
jgi:hypothetical protein